jgi:hypothetical protein
MGSHSRMGAGCEREHWVNHIQLCEITTTIACEITHCCSNTTQSMCTEFGLLPAQCQCTSQASTLLLTPFAVTRLTHAHNCLRAAARSHSFTSSCGCSQLKLLSAPPRFQSTHCVLTACCFFPDQIVWIPGSWQKHQA